MAEPRILVLVLAINRDPWHRIEIDGQLPTWRCSSPNNVRIFRYIGKDPQSLVWKVLNKLWMVNQKVRDFSHGKISVFSINLPINRRKPKKSYVDFKRNEIITNVPDLYSLIGAKTLDAFDVSVQNFEFDYIYRTNVSSYLNLVGLQQFIEDKPRDFFYGGAIGNHQGINFASGCGYFISRDLVNQVLQKRELWDHNLIDDVALGKLLTRDLNVDIHDVKRMDLDSPDLDLDQINDNQSDIFHYRCKASNPNTTIKIMSAVHKFYSNKL